MHAKTSDALRDFAELIMSRPDLQDELGEYFEANAFCEAALRIASEHNIAFDPTLLEREFGPDPLGLRRFEQPALAGGRWPAHGWLPGNTVAMGAEPAFDWAWFGHGALDDPFFGDSLRRATALPLSRVLRRRHTLRELCASAPDTYASPAGFVFHLSRCGSTLLGRLLASFPGHACLSEPEPLDAVVQWAAAQAPGPDGLPAPESLEALRVMIAALMNNLPAGTRAFFKLDCWHIGALPLFRAAFPDVPWLFLYRDPVEVAVSQLEMPGVHVVPGMPGARLLGVEGGEDLAREEYCAIVLGAICRAGTNSTGVTGGLLVHYDDIARRMDERIMRHFGITADVDAAERMASLYKVDSKFPDRTFAPDGTRKQAEAHVRLRSQMLNHVDTYFSILEKQRTDQNRAW